MNVGDCYRLLELDRGATLTDVKAAYRRLARCWHPDLNDQAGAHDRFIELQTAYDTLCAFVATLSTIPKPVTPPVPPTAPPATASPASSPSRPAAAPVDPPATTVSSAKPAPPLSDLDRQIKHNVYASLQQLLANERFPRAIALVEGLAERLQTDPEVRQWKAVTYQCFGRYYLERSQLSKARTYLTKAYRADPHNRELLRVVAQDLRRLDALYKQKRQQASGVRSIAIPDFFKTKHDSEHPTVRPTPAKKKRTGIDRQSKSASNALWHKAKPKSKRKTS
ncbi:MAG: J domain-containing protein [Coleofasciculaceae cyanobacterium RL_1_1]|nr:J domain-containing protein [Coleofasciculaceae cyanobacterium RL_1_1]